jgi:hypothetical protein
MERFGQSFLAVGLLCFAMGARAQGTVTFSRDEKTRDVIVTNSSMRVGLLAMSMVWRCDTDKLSMTFDYMQWRSYGNGSIVRGDLPLDAGKSFTELYSHNLINETCQIKTGFALYDDGSFTGTMDDLKSLKENRLATIRQILWSKDLLYREDSPIESRGRLQKKVDDWRETGNKTGRISPELASFGNGYLSPEIVVENVVGTMEAERNLPYMQRRNAMLKGLSLYEEALENSLISLNALIAKQADMNTSR